MTSVWLWPPSSRPPAELDPRALQGGEIGRSVGAERAGRPRHVPEAPRIVQAARTRGDDRAHAAFAERAALSAHLSEEGVGIPEEHVERLDPIAAPMAQIPRDAAEIARNSPSGDRCRRFRCRRSMARPRRTPRAEARRGA